MPSLRASSSEHAVHPCNYSGSPTSGEVKHLLEPQPTEGEVADRGVPPAASTRSPVPRLIGGTAVLLAFAGAAVWCVWASRSAASPGAAPSAALRSELLEAAASSIAAHDDLEAKSAVSKSAAVFTSSDKTPTLSPAKMRTLQQDVALSPSQTRTLQVSDSESKSLAKELSPAAYSNRFLLLPGKVEFALGEKIMVASKTGRNRVCTIFDLDTDRVQVHFDGFPEAFDEWVEKDSQRILGMAGTTTSTTHTSTDTTTTSSSSTETTTSGTTTTSSTMTQTTTTISTTTSTSVTTTTTTTPRRYISLFCFTLVRSSGYEISLVRLQVAKSVGLFDCDESIVYSDIKTWISEGPTYLQGDDGSKAQVLIHTTPIKLSLSDPIDVQKMQNDHHGLVEQATKLWQNAPQFVECWRSVLSDGRYKFHDWVVKLDPDTVFLPARLRSHLSKPPFVEHTGKKAYLRTCSVTPRKCVFSVRISRTWGDDWALNVIGQQDDTFSIGHCDSASDAGKGCIKGNWGNGINTIVNQHGEQVGYAQCCHEDNKVVSAAHECPQKQTEKSHPGISAAMEVFSTSAIDLYSKEGTKCLLDVSYKKWGEEYFMQECMDYLGAQPLEAHTMVQDEYCSGLPNNCSTDQVAFHPLKSDQAFFKCMGKTFQDLTTPELHADLLKVTKADG